LLLFVPLFVIPFFVCHSAAQRRNLLLAFVFAFAFALALALAFAVAVVCFSPSS